MIFSSKRLVVAAVALMLIGLAWLPMSDLAALRQSEAGLQRALTTYAIARGVNAVISMAQGTELAIQPWGIGAVVAIGQILDPINDLVEQLSSLMLLASVAFGVQILLIKMGGHMLVAIAFTAVAISYAVMAGWRGGAPTWLGRLLLVLALARFAVPICALGSEQVYQVFLQDEYVAAQQGLERSKVDLQAAEGQISDESVSAEVAQGEKAQSRWKAFRDSVTPSLPKIPDVRKIAIDIKQAAEASVRHMINLMVVFLLQTVVLPLLFLLGIVVAGRSLMSTSDARPGSATVSS
jgi:hypothetical protein